MTERIDDARYDDLDRFLTPGGRTRVIAHRGLSGTTPENTQAAFRAALGVGTDGPDMIELDVTLTSDGELVVIHDAELERTTDGTGPVSALTLRELEGLDAGSWFDPRFAGEGIPTLGEVLDLVHGRALLNVEIKEEAVSERTAGGIVEKVIELVHAKAMAGDVLISSFEPRALAQARDVDPGIARSALFDDVKHAGMGPVQVMDAVGARGFSPSRSEITAETVSECHAHGRVVNVYTVNEPEEMRMLIAMGVDGLFTDRADRLFEVLGS